VAHGLAWQLEHIRRTVRTDGTHAASCRVCAWRAFFPSTVRRWRAHADTPQPGRHTVDSAGTARGTDVRLRFPLVPKPEELERPGAERRLPDLSGIHILVVEDTDDSLEATSLMLERFGADVLAARDGFEALEAVAAGPVDLGLCDLRMPRMDGFE
jgi:Response regulator receiver domain